MLANLGLSAYIFPQRLTVVKTTGWHTDVLCVQLTYWNSEEAMIIWLDKLIMSRVFGKLDSTTEFDHQA